MNSKVKYHRLLPRKEYRHTCTYHDRIRVLPDETYSSLSLRSSKTSSSKVLELHGFGQSSLLNEMILLPHFFQLCYRTCFVCVRVCVYVLEETEIPRFR